MGEYDDQSCIMGYSYSQSDTNMCFNHAKNFQFGWFTDALHTVTLNSRFDGNIKGQINYQRGVSPQEPVIVKIDVSGSNDNYYVGFNHRAKYNSDVFDYANKVTIQRYTGTGYSISYSDGVLDAGQSWNNGKSGLERIEVTVRSLTTDPNTGRADISITYGGCTSNAQCNDGNSCNGVETCGTNGVCVAGTPLAGCCGNGFCGVSSEKYSSCSSDCAARSIEYWDASHYAVNAGAFFKVSAKEDVAITKFNVHAYVSGGCQFKIYTKSGDFVGSENNPNSWTLLLDNANVNCVGYNSETELPEFNSPVAISKGDVQSFYVFTPNGDQLYSNVGSPGTVNLENDELILYTGKRSAVAFGSVQSGPMKWNGKITYGLSRSTVNPTPNPTRPPTSFPTRVPTRNPSKQPTDIPTKQPTNAPSKQPTNLPSNQPLTNAPSKQPTNFPSNLPNQPPTNVALKIEILTDNYPGDTSWELNDVCPGGGQVASGGGYSNSNQLYSDSYPARNSRYEFIIFDSYGDGICCSTGSGSYTVYVDNETVASGGEFTGSSESRAFGQCPSDVNIGPSNVNIKVDIVTDNFASETTWTLRDVCPGGGQIAAGSGYSEPGKLYSDSITTKNSRFEFMIVDAYGDGICCGQGTGSYTVSVDDLPVASGGDFGQSQSKFFGECTGDVGSSDVTIRVDLQTDKFASETSWELQDVCPGGGQVATGSEYSEPETLYSTTYVTRNSRFEFLIADTYGDGICCEQGSGSYVVSMNNEPVASGGSFDSTESKFFGQCPGAAALLELPQTLNLWQIDCDKLEKTRCEATDVCEWRKPQNKFGNIFELERLREKSCYPLR